MMRNLFCKNIAMTSLGALLTHLFWNWKKLNLLESPFVAAAGFQLFISGPTRTTVYDKLSAFFQRDFLAYVNLSDFVLIFSVKLKLSKSTELLHFHEFLVLFWIFSSNQIVISRSRSTWSKEQCQQNFTNFFQSFTVATFFQRFYSNVGISVFHKKTRQHVVQ